MAIKGTILVVDDDPLVRDVLFPVLRKAGFEMVEARSGEEAIRVLERHTPDLALLDIRMHGMDGFALAQRLRAFPTTRAMPIILVTAHSPRLVELEGGAAGADYYVPKPFDTDDVVADVYTVLAYRGQVAPGKEQLRAFRRLYSIPGSATRERELMAPVPPEQVSQTLRDSPETAPAGTPDIPHQPIGCNPDQDDRIHRNNTEVLRQALKQLELVCTQLRLLLLDLEDRVT